MNIAKNSSDPIKSGKQIEGYINSRGMIWKKQCIILFLTSLAVILVAFRADLSKLCIVDYKGEGRYFSRQYDSILSSVNTLGYDKIGIKEEVSPDGVFYRFKKKDNEKIVIRLLKGVPYSDLPTEYRNIVGVSIFGKGLAITKKDDRQLYAGNNRIEIPRSFLSNNDEVEIRLSKANDKAPALQQTIRRIEVAFLPNDGRVMPNLPLLLTYLSLPLLLYLLLIGFGMGSSKGFALGLISIPLIYVFRYVFAVSPFDYLLFFLYSLVFLNLIFSYKFKRNINFSWFFACVFILIVIQAVYLRWQELEIMAFAPPHLDAGGLIGYRSVADNLQLPFKGIFIPGDGIDQHERMYPFIVRLFFLVFGSSDLHIRFVSLFFSMLTVIFCFFVVREMLRNNFLALLAMFVLAINSAGIENSVYGLRTELEAFLLILLFYFGWLKVRLIKNRPWLWAISTGVTASILVLVRGFYLPAVLFLIIYFILVNKSVMLKNKIFPLLIVIFIVLLPYSFWKIQIFQKHHSLMWDQEVYTRVTASFEFNDKSLLSRKVTVAEYFFKMHSPYELIRNYASGIAGSVFLLNGYAFNIAHLQSSLVKSLISRNRLTVSDFFFLPYIMFTLIISCLSFLYIIINRQKRVLFWVIITCLYYSIFFIGFFVITGRALICVDRAVLPLLPFFIIAILSFMQFAYSFLLKPRLRTVIDKLI